MTQFDTWARDLADQIGSTPSAESPKTRQIHPDLEGWGSDEGDYEYPCRSCGEYTCVEDPENFDPDYHYCGRNQWCVP